MKNKGQIRHTEKLRHRPPKVIKGKDGKVVGLVCPFCNEPHQLAVDSVALCGAYLEIRAVQPVFHGNSVKCARCGESGGTFTKMGENLYVHANPCVAKNFYAEVPKMSFWAGVVWNLMPNKPNKLVTKIVRRVGWMPEELVKTGKDGIPTGDVIGYHWKKVTDDTPTNK